MINVTVTNAVYLVIGTLTLLKQFNPNFRNQFISILSQYVRSCINLNNIQRPSDLPVDISKVVGFLEEFIHFSDLDKKVNFLVTSCNSFYKFHQNMFFFKDYRGISTKIYNRPVLDIRYLESSQIEIFFYNQF